MPRWDFRCLKCGRVIRDVSFPTFGDMRIAEDAQELECSCGGKLDRLPTTPNFKVLGFNAKNGYSK